MHPKQIALEDKLHKMCIDLDNHLEDMYGSLFPLHPNRMKRGKTASANYDGLFSTGTQFTNGYGSTLGRGFLIDIDIRTLSWVKKEDVKMIEDEAIEYLNSIISTYLPERKLEVKRDQNVIKIVGDFSLGSNDIN